MDLDFIAGLRDSGVLKCVRLDMVVQDNNFRDIPDFIGIARQHDFHCELMRIVNWGTFDDEEFARKNIFYLGHPEHPEFRRVMRSLAAYEKLSLGNLPEFVRPESEARFHMPHWRDTIRDKRDPPPKS